MNQYKPKKYLLIEGPETNRISSHPEAILISGTKKSYIIPPNIWLLYKDSFYINEKNNSSINDKNYFIDKDISSEDDSSKEDNSSNGNYSSYENDSSTEGYIMEEKCNNLDYSSSNSSI